MTNNQDQVLLVASRGRGSEHGLWLWNDNTGGWSGRQVDTVRDLSALTGHPHLPVVYGTAGIDDEGTIHAWRIDLSGETVLGAKSSEGAEPCHLVVDPTGKLLVVTNYTTGTLALQRLDGEGRFEGGIALVKLEGSGPEKARQDAAHPHQAFFNGDTLVVIDLGADLIREFRVDLTADGASMLEPLRTTPAPAGSGPRHGVVLPDGRLAISGELGENLLTGNLGGDADGWADLRSTKKTGPAQTRWDRNYPGDIQRSADGRHIYFANRSYNTIATFDVTEETPTLVAEIDATVEWPQHIIVEDDRLLVAGWDTSRVVAMLTEDGIPQRVEPLFDCDAAGWLHLHRTR